MDAREDPCHTQVSEEDEDEQYMYHMYEGDEFEMESYVIAEENSAFVEPSYKKKMNNYSILSEGDIRQRQEEATARVCSIFSLSKDEAAILLIQFEWNIQRVIDEWLVKEEDIRRDLGLMEIRVRVLEVDPNSDMQCGICNEPYSVNGMSSGVCGHYFCNVCWLNWIQAQIDETGARCLRLKCLEPSCNCAIGRDMVLYLLNFADPGYLKCYENYFVRSYVDSNREIKWCPAPGCEYAVEMGNPEIEIESAEIGSPKIGSGFYEVTCKCLNEFCWNCSDEAHRPVACETAKKWMLKNRDNAENEKWKLVNTKPCPKCGCAIEKNNGCMHMTCAEPCNFEFCWICLAAWSSHGYIHVCNKLPDKEAGLKRKREIDTARKALEKYDHYYERWAANESSKTKAVSVLHHFQKFDPELQFLSDAWLQIVECRRVLKWTYAYGYYIPEIPEREQGLNQSEGGFNLNQQEQPASRVGSWFNFNLREPHTARVNLWEPLTGRENLWEPATARARTNLVIDRVEPRIDRVTRWDLEPQIDRVTRWDLEPRTDRVTTRGPHTDRVTTRGPHTDRVTRWDLEPETDRATTREPEPHGVNLWEPGTPTEPRKPRIRRWDVRVTTKEPEPHRVNLWEPDTPIELRKPRIRRWDVRVGPGFHVPPNPINANPLPNRVIDDSRAKKNLFEHLQAYAESSLERLHYCAEGFSHKSQQDFTDFRTKLIDLTKVTRRYFENLVQALEKDLSDG